MSADASENLHRIDVQLVAGKAVERHPQEDVLGLHGLVELDFGGAAGVELELGDLFTLVRAGLGVHANVALAAGRTDLDDHAIRFLGLAEVEVITVTLLSVRIGQELAVVDLTASIMCMENKMPMYGFGLNEENSIVNAMSGKFSGTKVTV